MAKIMGWVSIGVALLTATPTWAGPVDEVGPAHGRAGGFAGARMRLTLGGAERAPLRAGLALTSTRTLQRADGRARTIYGDGIEFGFAGDKFATLSVAGRPVGHDGSRRNLSTGATIALIGGGVLLVAGVGLLLLDARADAATE